MDSFAQTVILPCLDHPQKKYSADVLWLLYCITALFGRVNITVSFLLNCMPYAPLAYSDAIPGGGFDCMSIMSLKSARCSLIYCDATKCNEDVTHLRLLVNRIYP